MNWEQLALGLLYGLGAVALLVAGYLLRCFEDKLRQMVDALAAIMGRDRQ